MCTYLKSPFDVPPTQPLLCSFDYYLLIIILKDTLYFFWLSSTSRHRCPVLASLSLWIHVFQSVFCGCGTAKPMKSSTFPGQIELVIFKVAVLCFLLQDFAHRVPYNSASHTWIMKQTDGVGMFAPRLCDLFCICHCGMQSNTENPLLASCIHFQNRAEEENQRGNKRYEDV